MAEREKRQIVWECLQDRHTSADAILNALHQGGWAVIPKAEIASLRELADRAAGNAKSLSAADDENEMLRNALSELVRLKDGPRDRLYELQKPQAWQNARNALAAVERTTEGTP